MHKYLVFILPLIALGQNSGSIAGPVLGYAYDEGSRGIRLISGVPGAASYESGLPLGSALGTAYVAANRNFAIAPDKLGEQLLLIDWTTGTAVTQPLEGAVGKGVIALSPSGDSAAAFFPAKNQILVWTGLPKNSNPRQIDLSAISSPVTAVAVSDEGAVVLVAVSDGNSGTVYAATADGLASLRAGGLFPALSFAPHSHDAVAADQLADQVILIRDAGGSSTLSVIASSGQGVGKPASAAFSADGNFVVVGNLRTTTLLRLDLAAGSAVSTDCACRPERLSRLTGNSIFLIGSTADPDSSSLAVTLFDGDSSSPRVSLIPSATLASIDGRRVAGGKQ